MPEAMRKASQGIDRQCARCHNVKVTFVVRAEQLCNDCFIKYISTKVVKRLELNKLRAGFNQPVRKLLLPLSLGISSTCLLHLLDAHLKERSKQGRRPSFALHLLYVEESSILGSASQYKRIEMVKSVFPSYNLDVISLEDCFNFGIEIDKYMSEERPGKNDDLLQRLKNCLAAAHSPTSKVDLLQIVRDRLITAFAQRNACDHIIYGHTATRLAERTLSETAKGRGGFLPWLIMDNVAVQGVGQSYPLRDLLKKETQIYADVVDSPLMPLVMDDEAPKIATSSRDSSIDTLMCDYFTSVEENYPSIVANVVKTTGKLNTVEVPSGTPTCNLCLLPLTSEALYESLSPGSLMQMQDSSKPDRITALCHGCSQTLNLD